MVQASQFYGKAHEDVSAHLQHFLGICNTFMIRGVPKDTILLHLFPFSLLGKAKQWFYTNKDKHNTLDLCSTTFLAKFFPTAKKNAMRGKISSFQQQHDESFTEAWERFQNYIEDCPHHGIEEWLLMQTLYHRLISSTREFIDAAAGGAFLSLKLLDAKAIVEKMASNSICNEERTQYRNKGGVIHHLKEADMVTAKLDLIMNKLNIEKEVMHINDSHMTCEECGDYGHSATNCPTLQEDVNFINNNT